MTRKRVISIVLSLCVTAAAVVAMPITRLSAAAAAGPSTRPVATPSTRPVAAPVASVARQPMGVCPPFKLLDEQGNVIDPAKGINANVPYSPRQTCGGCHNYDRITEGYHFTQGAGESPTATQRQRMLWALSPGNFGGNWCSPAPLYSHLAPKQNGSAVTIDMTAYRFLLSCGVCHPGGGPAELDRDGRRYDRWIADPASGFADGADNNFDGDYHKAMWGKSGVLEADCLLCHLPGYDYAERVRQIGQGNFRWAALAGSRLAKVSGAVARNEAVQVEYNASFFNPDGTIDLPLVRSPQNAACLSCHQQPGWKKRGANFRPRTDVHLRAGLRCVDCHPAGSSATDPRINGHEMHQIAKGDDPGGLVRDDLDNTMVSCADCHNSGRLGAPLPRHRGLPPLHLDRIACQTCHIPERLVMPIQFQASDVFNPAPRIPVGGKQLWTFYGPDGQWRNHYGYLEMMGYDNKPTERFRPVLARYNGKIYPVNRVHSAWPGIQIDGQSALMQPRMSDIRRMWLAHREDPSRYPSLARIVDDNGDGVPEVNRPDEIDALIEAVSLMLAEIKYPMEGKRVVWVYNDRVYRSGTEFQTVPKEPWEASPYANVHKYSHDVLPARAALGSGGCTDCHSAGSPFFSASVMQYPFDVNADPVFVSQAQVLGIGPASVWLGAVREQTIKPAMLWITVALVVLLLTHYVVFGPRQELHEAEPTAARRFSAGERLTHLGLMLSFIGLAGTGGVVFFTGWLAADTIATVHVAHRILGFAFVFFVALIVARWWRDARPAPEDREWWRHLGGYFGQRPVASAGRFNAGQKAYFWAVLVLAVAMLASGFLLIWPAPVGWAPLLFTLHVTLAGLLVMMVLAHFYLAVLLNPRSISRMFRGEVAAADA